MQSLIDDLRTRCGITEVPSSENARYWRQLSPEIIEVHLPSRYVRIEANLTSDGLFGVWDFQVPDGKSSAKSIFFELNEHDLDELKRCLSRKEIISTLKK